MKTIINVTILMLFFYAIACKNGITRNFNETDANKIHFEVDSSGFPRINALQFSVLGSKSKYKVFKIEPSNYAVLSPEGSKAAIISPPISSEQLSTIKIYNNYGEELNNIKVKALSELAISEKGDIVLYGFPALVDYLSVITQVLFLNSSGAVMNPNDYFFGPNTKGVYSKGSNYFILLADSTNQDYIKRRPRELIIYDRDGNLLNRHVINDWWRNLDLLECKIEANEAENKIYVYTKISENKTYKKCIDIFDFKGNFMERIEGWDKN